MSQIVLVLGAGGGLVLIAIVAFALLRGGDKQLKARLQRASQPLGAKAAGVDAEVDAEIFRTIQPRARSGRFWQIVQARYPLIEPKKSALRALLAGMVGAVGFGFATWLIKIPTGWWTLPLIGVAGIGSVFYTMAWLQGRQVNEFNRQFPEIIDQIVRLSRAGVPALEAVAVISEDTQPPVEPILRDVCEGLLAGLDTDTALRSVSARVRLAEFTLFTAVIRLQRRSGGSVSTAFANLSQTLRERRSTSMQARASTAQTRLTLLVLTVMPVLVLIGQTFIAPDSVDMLFNSERGNGLLHWGVGLIVAGLLAARFIASRAEQ